MQEDSSLHPEAKPAEQFDATLPRSAILRGRNAFTAVFNSGNGTRFGRLVVKYRTVPAERTSVVAGFVMRRGSGNAVRRNRLKRLMREAYRHERRMLESRLPDGIELQLVLLWSGSPAEAPYESLDRLRADLAGALRKIVHRLRPRHDERSDR
jgi:ribonuclease P protein component